MDHRRTRKAAPVPRVLYRRTGTLCGPLEERTRTRIRHNSVVHEDWHQSHLYCQDHGRLSFVPVSNHSCVWCVYVCMCMCRVVCCACVLKWLCVCVESVCGVCAESVWDVRFVCCVCCVRCVCCVYGVVCVVCVVCVCGVVYVYVVCVWRGLARGKPRVYFENVSVCRFKTPPCVLAKRAHVQHMRAFCLYTRRRF